ncbi:hypothetical protein GH714_021003 [Hevea brasiliensis]|uniref:MULE transposase domain-containing protein n=1 Tax=Hevea brasiliensis TaxID=3981 RepID=A0A6A6LA15_HEVBR|nr:hypothetical protein GH714_021003 [Hevea brasiliensis]
MLVKSSMGLNEGRSYRRQLFDEIFDFSEDDSLFAEDVEEDESAGDQDMNEGGIGAVANTNAIEEGPLTGMLFPCISTMFNFYKEHARLKGRKAIGAKSSKRINWLAKINTILRENGMWQISKVISSHNHELEPSMSRLMVAHRSLNMDMKRRLEANDIAGIRPAKSIRLLEVQRRLRLGDGDAEAIRKLFVRMQRNDPEFFYSFDLNDDSRRSKVLWVHPRSRAAYEEFNDVVSFDTTYLVNRYKLPFATIVGVNHHGQSILLGCALISHEDVNTFKWLFITWLEAMGDVHPNSILTNQCESMRKAIREGVERLFQEASNLAYDDNKIKFVKQQLAELKQDLLSWNDGMIAPTSNAQATIDTNNVDENEENERVILNPHVTRSRGQPRINTQSVREITQRANSVGIETVEGAGVEVGPHNSQTQGNVTDAVINPIVSNYTKPS